jgi:hypothetical protein
VWPFEKKLVDAIHSMGGRVRLHICGNTRKILSGMGKLGCEMVDIDFPVSLEEARTQMGPRQVLAGNLNPVKGLRDGTPEAILQALEACYRQAGPSYIVAAVRCAVTRRRRTGAGRFRGAQAGRAADDAADRSAIRISRDYDLDFITTGAEYRLYSR